MVLLYKIIEKIDDMLNHYELFTAVSEERK